MIYIYEYKYVYTVICIYNNIYIQCLDEELKVDLFFKPTDTHQFLDTTSSHPYHCKKGIPYS